jgi:hypothetical protein
MFQLSWRRKTFFVHATVDEVLRNVDPEQHRTVLAIFELATSRGLLSGPARDSLSPARSASKHAS